MSDEPLVKVEIDTMEELFPAVVVGRSDRSDFAVPAALIEAYETAGREVDRAERAVLQYVADHYPQAEAIRKCLADEFPR